MNAAEWRQIDFHPKRWERQLLPLAHDTKQRHQTKTFFMVLIESPLAAEKYRLYL